VRRSFIYPPVYTFYKIIGEWYSVTGKLAPIYKKGNKTKVNSYSYHPVCLTSIVIKIFESIKRDTMSKYLYDNNLLSPNQHGSVPRRSCCTQLPHAFNDWTLSLDKNLSSDIVYFWFFKSFWQCSPYQTFVKAWSIWNHW